MANKPTYPVNTSVSKGTITNDSITVTDEPDSIRIPDNTDMYVTDSGSEVPKTASHYHERVITQDMVGMTVDPAFIVVMFGLGPISLQYLKKLLNTKPRNSGKTVIQDREEALFMIQREIDLMKLFSKGKQ